MTLCPMGGDHAWDGTVPCPACMAGGADPYGPVETPGCPRTGDSTRDGIMAALKDGAEAAAKNPVLKRKAKRGRSKPQPEGLILKAILAFLREQGVFCWRVSITPLPLRDASGGFAGWKPNPMAGHPDVAGVLPECGRACFFEVKTPTGRVSDIQQRWLDRLTAQGALAAVARSVEDVREVLNREGYLTVDK